MTWAAVIVATVACVSSYALVRQFRSYALNRALLDVPNERSSHSEPTPSGGGLAIVIVVLLAIPILWILGLLETPLALALIGGTPVAVVGFADDRRPVPPGVRLGVHIVAAVWAITWLGGVPPFQVGSHVVDLGWLGHGLGLVAIVWVLNLFNFMDGIDGLAGSEAAFITGAGAALAATLGQAPGVAAIGLTIAAACMGFLPWNWPPARIFMGDAGSGFLGFVVAVLAIAATRTHPAAGFCWLILGSVFFIDATITFFRRLVRGERVHQAHRSHAYQRLSRRWRGHRPVTLAVIAINLAWALPLAAASLAWPRAAVLLTVLAITPIAVVVYTLGAGLPEQDESRETALPRA